MEVESKQGPMVGWAVRKDSGTSKAMFIQSNWKRNKETHKARARRSHTRHREWYRY